MIKRTGVFIPSAAFLLVVFALTYVLWPILAAAQSTAQTFVVITPSQTTSSMQAVIPQTASPARSPKGTVIRSASPQAVSVASNQFLEFLRFPAELNSNLGSSPISIANAQSIQMANNTAYFRDFFEGGVTVTSGPNDGDTIGAQVFDPNGVLVATFFTSTFHASLTVNGQPQQNCWTSPDGTVCNATTITVTWIAGLQCASKGTYQMSFLYNNQAFFTGSFTMLPQIEASRVPGDNQNPVQGGDATDYSQLDYEAQIGDFCRFVDATGNVIRHSTHPCASPLGANEQIATIHQLGCAMTSTAMVLGYHGAITAPDTLNDWLSVAPDPAHPQQLRGYDTGGGILWTAVGDYAGSRGIQLAFDWKGSNSSLGQQACSAGPSVISVKSNTHWVLTYGQPFDQSTWLLHDPNGGVSRNLSSTNPPYNNVSGAKRSFAGNTETFVTNYGLSIRLHSPAELLLTSPTGRRTGLDPVANVSYSEDANSSYDDISIGDLANPSQAGIEEKELIVGVPPAGDFTLQVTGTDIGNYTLEFLGQDNTGVSSQTVFLPVPTAPGMVHMYTIHMNLVNAAPPSFSGALVGNGANPDANLFLTFANPTRQASLVPAGQNNFPLIIFYGSTVNAPSFTASLNGQSVTSLFHPAAGTSETVNIPLPNGVSSLTVQISGSTSTGQVATDADTLQFDVGGSAPQAPTSLTATAITDTQINLAWTASSSGVTYSVFRGTTSGFTPSAATQIASGLTGMTFADTGLTASTTYFYLVEAIDTFASSAASNQASATTMTPGSCSGVASTISTNFNGTAIPSGDSIWSSSVAKVSGLGSTRVTIFVRKSNITFIANGTTTTVAVPDANLTFDPSVTTATTTFNTSLNLWQTVVPSKGLAGNVFLDGAELMLPNGLPGGIKNVAWTATFSSDTPGISLNWQWAAAAYTSLGVNCTSTSNSPDLNDLEVKPVDDNKASQYQNSDHAGTPEDYKPSVVGGATGGGGSNYTGSYSGTKSATPVVVNSCGTSAQPPSCGGVQ